MRFSYAGYMLSIIIVNNMINVCNGDSNTLQKSLSDEIYKSIDVLAWRAAQDDSMKESIKTSIKEAFDKMGPQEKANEAKIMEAIDELSALYAAILKENSDSPAGNRRFNDDHGAVEDDDDDCGCDCLSQKTCSKITALNTFTCMSGQHVIALTMLCDGTYDCGDGSDEERCAQTALKKLQKTKLVIAAAKKPKFTSCFDHDGPIDGTSNAFSSFVSRQIDIMKSLETTPAGLYKDRIASEKVAKEAVVAVSFVAGTLNRSICSEKSILDLQDQGLPMTLSATFASEEDLFASGFTKCSCINGTCIATKKCAKTCRQICRNEYTLSQWPCSPVEDTGHASVPLDLVCDGKLDCWDESDEADCREGENMEKFKAITELTNTLEIIKKKIQSAEYSPVKPFIISLGSDLSHLLKLNMAIDVDTARIKTTRDNIFQSLSKAYSVMANEKASAAVDVYDFLEDIGQRVIRALKRTYTGNARVIQPGQCFCRETLCGVRNCTEECSLSCSADSELNRFHCSAAREVSLPLDAICDGKTDCPNAADEMNCNKAICQKLHFIKLREEITNISNKLAELALGEYLKSWQSEVLRKITTKSFYATRPTIEDLRTIIQLALRELTNVYIISKNKDNLKTFSVLSENLLNILKLCSN